MDHVAHYEIEQNFCRQQWRVVRSKFASCTNEIFTMLNTLAHTQPGTREYCFDAHCPIDQQNDTIDLVLDSGQKIRLFEQKYNDDTGRLQTCTHIADKALAESLLVRIRTPFLIADMDRAHCTITNDRCYRQGDEQLP